MISYRTELLQSWVSSEPSVRSLGNMLGISAPFTMRDLVDRLRVVETLQLDCAIHTDDGAPITGGVKMTLHSDGHYEFRGHVRATGLYSYHWAIQAWVGSGSGGVILAQKIGSVFGTDTPGPALREWNEVGINLGIEAAWRELRAGTTLTVKFDANVSGVLGGVVDVLTFALEGIAANVILGPAGWYVLIGNELAGLDKQIDSPDILGGIVIGAGVFLIAGPFGLVPAVLAGVITAAVADIKHRSLNEEEIRFAQQVFGNKVRYEDIVITDMQKSSGRKFTMPSIGNTILMALGPDAFHDPMNWADIDNDDYKRPGEVFIHEMTHAWQISNTGPIHLVCNLSGDYTYKDDPTWSSRDWGSFNLEEQAHIVDDWYGDHRADLNGPAALADPAFHFIRDVIRSAS